MAWFREWLQGVDTAPRTPDAAPADEGPEPAGRRARPEARTGATTDAAEDYPGRDFGLPAHGPDSVATLPLRGGQFLLDILLASLVTAAFTFPATSPYPSIVVWVALVWLPVAVLGRTPAMVLTGVRVARVDGAVSVGPWWALVRTASLFFLVPALLVDRDARGLQDRVSRTIVLRTR